MNLFLKAAQHLYINQPRLSKIIKEIEEEANIKIFERHNKGVVPTTKGRELSQAKNCSSRLFKKICIRMILIN